MRKNNILALALATGLILTNPNPAQASEIEVKADNISAVELEEKSVEELEKEIEESEKELQDLLEEADKEENEDEESDKEEVVEELEKELEESTAEITEVLEESDEDKSIEDLEKELEDSTNEIEEILEDNKDDEEEEGLTYEDLEDLIEKKPEPSKTISNDPKKTEFAEWETWNVEDKLVEGKYDEFDYEELVPYEILITNEGELYIPREILKDVNKANEETGEYFVSIGGSIYDLTAEDLGPDFNIEYLDFAVKLDEVPNFNRLDTLLQNSDYVKDPIIMEDLMRLYAKAYAEQEDNTLDFDPILKRANEYGIKFYNKAELEDFMGEIKMMSFMYLDDNQNDFSRYHDVNLDDLIVDVQADGSIIASNAKMILESREKANARFLEDDQPAIYLMDDEQKEAVDKEIDRIISTLDDSWTDEEKARHIANIIVEGSLYSQRDPELPPYNHNAYGALIEKESVCQGFADAYTMTLRRAGIPAFTMTGKRHADDEEYHAWNFVKIDGEWLIVDITNAVAMDRLDSTMIEDADFLQHWGTESFLEYYPDFYYMYMETGTNENAWVSDTVTFNDEEIKELQLEAKDIMDKFIKNGPEGIDFEEIEKPTPKPDKPIDKPEKPVDNPSNPNKPIDKPQPPVDNPTEAEKTIGKPEKPVETPDREIYQPVAPSIRPKDTDHNFPSATNTSADIVYVPAGYKRIKEGFYSRKALADSRAKLQKAVATNQEIIKAAKILLEYTPATVAKIAPQLKALIVKAERLNTRAGEVIGELNIILK